MRPRACACVVLPMPGEVLLLVHWSVLAYTATVKILKKHHKRTGLLLRAPQLADLLSQPFCSSEVRFGWFPPRPWRLVAHSTRHAEGVVRTPVWPR